MENMVMKPRKGKKLAILCHQGDCTTKLFPECAQQWIVWANDDDVETKISKKG